jgi:GH25 family lysozyme M1 (1,4-beta-N-acetylmuramidase)
MTALTVSIAPAAGVAVPPDLGSFFLDAIYSRSLNTETSSGLTDLPSVVQDTARAALDGKLHGSLNLPDVAPSSSVDLCFLGGNGGVRLRKTVVPTGAISLSVELSKDDVAAITAPDPQPVPRNTRRAFFVPVTDQRVPFESSRLQIAPIPLGNKGWTQLGLDQLFHSDLAITTSVQWNGSLPPGLVTQSWAPFPLAADGQFAFSFPVNSGDAWLWWLSGPLSALGVVIDDLAATRVVRIGVGLPPFSGPAPSVDGQRLSFDVTEAQVATHPNIYTEDPGEFCKPFSNPERVLGERSFFVILRAEQPVISAEATVHKVPLPVMTYAPQAVLSPAPVSNNPFISGSATTRNPSDTAASAAAGDGVRPAPGTLSDGTSEVIFVRHTIPTAYSDVLSRVDRGRTEMDATHPMQWEDDSSRYQAVTVARGHILEFRMRWRSNGYSLGTVAKTLTLSPRQVRHIEKVEWRRSEASRREETTRLFDQVSDTLSRDRTYEDAVQTNLSEWEHGDSHASMESGAGGFGFAAGGFVIGGGGGASNADSSSNQQAGRSASASEEQRLRDTIRRYGDALRKLDSLVVNEVTQEEAATGTTEIVRNPNYGHSLTVIHYQILHHLKVETAIAGVRECLFVPFAISPFTLARTYRWRELIQAGMRDQQYSPAMRYLKDVLTNFTYSDVPVGRRSDQPVRYIHGSLFLKLGIERPVDKEDGAFDQAAWRVVRPYLGSPALSIYQRLKAIDEAQRDIVFQQQHAGVIAASWVDTLLMDASGVPLHADFTLATRYQFNSTVRVDFSIQAPAGVTRETLATIRVWAGKDLPPGSVANLESMTLTYATDQFEHTISASQGSGDLVVETGVHDTGATIGAIPDTWERTNMRAEMISAVNDLLEHLNQHVEYYTKLILWGMDRDKLWMMIDGFYVPGTNQVSIASVVERDPVAIIGNALVFRVSSGSFLGLGNIKTPTDLFNHYVSLESPSEPMLVSLPTDGLYAQTIMDECAALEEHFGNTDWVLNDPDPALGEIAPELLASRRAEPQGTQPTQLPQTIINLQNAPEAPAPSGLAGALSAVTNANAFRDMTGLAGTQANAASAFQTAANLATNFGNQAAALKLAELAKDAHAAQTADQKLATVQRAVDKNLVTPDVAQQHASQILDQLHGSSGASPANQREAAVTQAVFAASASGKPFSVQHATADGVTTVSLVSDTSPAAAAGAATGGATPAAPPAPLPNRVDGIDIYDGNAMPSTDRLNELGISFVIHKSSDGAGHLDTQYQMRRDAVRASGIIYGSFHFFRFWTAATLDDSVTAQVNQAVGVVQRLLPGELGPSLDFEEQSWNHEKLGHKNPVNPWTPKQWVDAIQKYFDGVETAFGRRPIIYTSWQVWHDAVEDNNHTPLADADIDPDTSLLRDYSLWVKMYYNPPSTRYTGRLTRLPDELRDLPTPWLDWAIWQYSDVKPTELADLEAQTDMDVAQGTIYRLRGMADLDHTAPHISGYLSFIAFSQPDGRVHLLTNFGFWMDWDLFNDITPQPPLAGGDPAAAVIGDEQVIIYRDRNGHIQALSRTISGPTSGWTVTDVTNATGASAAADDPFLTVVQNQLHAVYWDTNDHQVHLWRTGDWHTEDLTGIVPGAPSASGSGVVYELGNSLHVVSRADVHGHLFDLAGAGSAPLDLTANAHVTAGAVPAATYRPSVYEPAGRAPRIVFRALRGDIWQIERDTLNATNLSATAGHAPAAVGSPSSIVSDTVHIFYRTLDDTIIEMFDDAGTWKRRTISCDAIPVADPTGFVDPNGHAAVSFRTSSGGIRVARLLNGAWQCEDAT